MNPRANDSPRTEKRSPFWTHKRRAALLVAIGVLFVSTIVTLGVLTVQRVKRHTNQVKSRENLIKIAGAFEKYDAIYHSLPGQAILHSETGEPLLSWRVTLLPYLGEESLYKQIHLDEPWDSEHNRQFWDRMPDVYRLPGKVNEGTTFYQVFHGERSLFGKPDRLANGRFSSGVKYHLRNILHEPSNTILVVEAARPVNWMKPQDIPFAVHPEGTLLNLVGNHWGDGTFLVTLCDCSCRTARRGDVSPKLIQGMIDPEDVSILPPSKWCTN